MGMKENELLSFTANLETGKEIKNFVLILNF